MLAGSHAFDRCFEQAFDCVIASPLFQSALMISIRDTPSGDFESNVDIDCHDFEVSSKSMRYLNNSIHIMLQVSLTPSKIVVWSGFALIAARPV